MSTIDKEQAKQTIERHKPLLDTLAPDLWWTLAGGAIGVSGHALRGAAIWHGLLPPEPTRCTVQGCEETHWAAGMCCKHYWRMRTRGTTEKYERPKTARVPECGHPERRHMAKGLCVTCYQAQYKKEHRE